MVTTKKGVFLGFLTGIFVALVVAGGAGFWIYKTIQARLSPPAIRETAEKNLSDAIVHPVTVGDASIGLTESVLVFGEIEVTVENETMVSVDRIEARAESLQGLRDRQFVELVVTRPTLSLKRHLERWNLESFLDPILAKMGAPSVPESTPESTDKNSPPIAHVQVTDAEITVSLDGGTSYSGLQIGNLDLRRENLEAPWDVRLENCKVRLNPSLEEWPILELVDLVQELIPANEIEAASGPDADATPSNPLEKLGTVTLENITFELIHPRHQIALGSFSFKASRLFEMIRVQTGTLKKKSPPPAS